MKNLISYGKITEYGVKSHIWKLKKMLYSSQEILNYGDSD